MMLEPFPLVAGMGMDLHTVASMNISMGITMGHPTSALDMGLAVGMRVDLYISSGTSHCIALGTAMSLSGLSINSGSGMDTGTHLGSGVGKSRIFRSLAWSWAQANLCLSNACRDSGLEYGLRHRHGFRHGLE